VPFQINEALLPEAIGLPSTVRLFAPVLFIYSMRPAVADVGEASVRSTPVVEADRFIVVATSTVLAAEPIDPSAPKCKRKIRYFRRLPSEKYGCKSKHR
jgi:hypothetical protein